MRSHAIVTASAAIMLMATAASAQELAKLQIGDDQRVFPESITSTADGTIYAGSMMSGTIGASLVPTIATRCVPARMSRTAWFRL